MPEPISDATCRASAEAERLMHGGNFAAAVEILAKIVEREADLLQAVVHARFVVSGTRRSTTKHFATPRPRWKVNPPPRRPEIVLAKVNVARGGLRFRVVGLRQLSPPCAREQRAEPPDQYAIPAHFALHNLEQLDHILTSNRDKQASAGALTEKF